MNKYGTDTELDKLVDSKDWEDRENAALYGYGLDKLINDKNYQVRRAVAEQCYGLDKLINDENWVVRATVARQRYGLDKLINDEDYHVRGIVACYGYGLNVLIYDENNGVCETAYEYLHGHNLTLEEWCEQHNIEYSNINTELKDFVYKIEDSSKIKVKTSYDSVDKFFEDTSDKSYENKESITIIAVDTKTPLIKLEKNKSKNKNVFKFIVDVSIEDNDFIIRSIFDNKEKFDQLLQSTINALREYSQFSKYADELESCI